MFKKFELKPNHELRGFMVRLYPDKDTQEVLASLEDDCRTAWNWLVNQTEEVLSIKKDYALKNNLVPPRPYSPEYDKLSPEESASAKIKYKNECIKWGELVHNATKNEPTLKYRALKEWLNLYGDEHPYQLFSRRISWKYDDNDILQKIKPSALLLKALGENFLRKKIPGQHRKKFRRKNDSMPLQVRSGMCFELGNFGVRGKNLQYYNCQVKINGLKIKGRLPGKLPEGRILEGISLTKKADGWWASIKQEVPIRVLLEAKANTVIGIDVGLDNIVAMANAADKSDDKIIQNPRSKFYVNKIAEKQKAKQPVGRLHLAAGRHTKHLIYNEIIKPLANTETIKVEKLSDRKSVV